MPCTFSCCLRTAHWPSTLSINTLSCGWYPYSSSPSVNIVTVTVIHQWPPTDYWGICRQTWFSLKFQNTDSPSFPPSLIVPSLPHLLVFLPEVQGVRCGARWLSVSPLVCIKTLQGMFPWKGPHYCLYIHISFCSLNIFQTLAKCQLLYPGATFCQTF